MYIYLYYLAIQCDSTKVNSQNYALIKGCV